MAALTEANILGGVDKGKIRDILLIARAWASCYFVPAAKILYWTLALALSRWYGKHAPDALDVPEDDKVRIAHNPDLRFHQFWFNFLGSLVGWSLLYVVLRHYRDNTTGVDDAILLFVAFVGMTGHLPFVVKHIWKWDFPWGKK